MIEEGSVDTCAIVYNKFVSAITQEVTLGSLVPAEVDNSTPKKAPAPSLTNTSLMKPRCSMIGCHGP